MENSTEVLCIKYNIDNSIVTHERLCNFSQDINAFTANNIIIDFENIHFFASNLFSILGCILSSYSKQRTDNFTISFQNVPSNIDEVMRKNGFCKHFNLDTMPDNNNTFIPYKIFDVEEIEHYERYLTLNLFARNDLPTMSNAVSDGIRDSLLELFKNVKDHTNSQTIYTCGQFFPKKGILYFTLVDSGETIPYNVINYHEINNLRLPNNLLEWAIMEGHSTSMSQSPRGLGLFLIKDFVALNNGILHITSGSETYLLQNGIVKSKTLSNPFPGTIVTIGLNLKDNSTYRFSYEKTTIQF